MFLWWCFCVGVVVFLCWCGGVFVVVFLSLRLCGGAFVVVFLWWCFCGGVFVVVFLWWCFCAGVFVVVFLWWCFCGGVFVVWLRWCSCGGVFVAVFLWWCSCGGVLVVVYKVLLQYYFVLQSTTPYYKVLLRTTPVLLRTTPVLLQYYKVLLRTTKYYSSTTKYYSAQQSNTPVLLRTTKYYSSTTPYYEVLLQHYSVLQSTTPVLLQYYSVLQTTPYYRALLRPLKRRQNDVLPVPLRTTPVLQKLPKRAFRARLPQLFTEKASKMIVSCEASSKFHRTSFQNERFARCFRQFSQKKLPKGLFCAMLPPNFTERASKTSVSRDASDNSHRKTFQNDHFVRGFLQIS